jgi:hypothetical protein
MSSFDNVVVVISGSVDYFVIIRDFECPEGVSVPVVKVSTSVQIHLPTGNTIK